MLKSGASIRLTLRPFLSVGCNLPSVGMVISYCTGAAWKIRWTCYTGVAGGGSSVGRASAKGRRKRKRSLIVVPCDSLG